MNNTTQIIEPTNEIVADTPPPANNSTTIYEKKLDDKGRAYATGKRKDAVARVWIKDGQGKIEIGGTIKKRTIQKQNNKNKTKATKQRDITRYFARPVLQMLIKQPLVSCNKQDKVDIIATVHGGGLSGQAGALRHGIARALVNFEPELRTKLKADGFITRDSRVVERKKYGKRKARRSFQFSKR